MVITVLDKLRKVQKRVFKKDRPKLKDLVCKGAVLTHKGQKSTFDFGNALGNFSELTEAVESCEPSVQLANPGANSKDLRKKWQKGALKRGQKLKADNLDIARYRALMDIPEFSTDPIAAIEQHLLNVQRKKEKKNPVSSKMQM